MVWVLFVCFALVFCYFALLWFCFGSFSLKAIVRYFSDFFLSMFITNVYKMPIDPCKLIVYSTSLLKMFISSKSFLELFEVSYV